MKLLSKSEIKDVQMEVLSQVAEFCEKNNLRYSLYGGTLLGAIRHKGYIPWDDDIDISMPRPDFNRMIEKFPSICNKHLKLHVRKLNRNFCCPFMKVSDERTRIQEFSRNSYKLGINIDIFPIDGLPENYTECAKLYQKSENYRNLIKLKRVRLTSDRAFYKNLSLLSSRVLLAPFSFGFLVDGILKQTETRDYSESAFIGNIVWGYGIKERCRKEVYGDYIQVNFENLKLKAMAGYHEYLQNVFGDYMQYPPKEKQRSQHDFKAFFKQNSDD